MKKTTTFSGNTGILTLVALLLTTSVMFTSCQKMTHAVPASTAVKNEVNASTAKTTAIEQEESEEGCSYSQGFYFASPHATWAEVSVGGHDYSYEQAVAIWKSSNKGGISDAKKAFLQVATIYLSGSSVGSGIIWEYVQAAEAYLYTLPKLTPTNVKNYNSSPEAAEAAGNIGDWIEEHHCE